MTMRLNDNLQRWVTECDIVNPEISWNSCGSRIAMEVTLLWQSHWNGSYHDDD